MLRRKQLMTRVRIFMLGVSQEFQSLPLGAALYARTFKVALAKGYCYGEASLILENNHRMRGALEKMGAVIEKTYRNYEIDLLSEAVATKEGAPDMDIQWHVKTDLDGDAARPPRPESGSLERDRRT